MSLAQWLLLTTMVFAVGVLLFKPLDAPRSLLVGLLAYMAPGLNKTTSYVYGVADTDERTVLIGAFVLLLTAIVGVIWPASPPSTQRLLRANLGGKEFSHFLSGCSILFLLFIMARHGPLFFAVVREETPLGGYEQVVYRTLASLTLMVGIVERSRSAIGMACLMLTIYTIMGDRTAVAMGAVAWFVHISYSKGYTGWQIVRQNWIVILLGVGFVVQGKQLYVAANAFVRGEAQIALNVAAARAGVPEPVLVFQTLNQTVKHNWGLEFQTLEGALPGLIPFSTTLGFRSDQFNLYMQNELFASVRPYSLAYNPWAEGWAMGGWLGIFVVWAILIVGLIAIHGMAMRRSGILHALACTMVAYVGFYSQRNTIRTEIAFVTQLCLAVGVLFLAFKAWKWLRESFFPQARFFETEPELPEGQAK